MLKDIDEYLDDDMGGTSEPLSRKSNMGKSLSTQLNTILRTRAYVIEAGRQFKGKRTFSLSFDQADLGREDTLTTIVSSHEVDKAAWLLPQVSVAPLVNSVQWPLL